jgi:cell division protein FtsQ
VSTATRPRRAGPGRAASRIPRSPRPVTRRGRRRLLAAALCAALAAGLYLVVVRELPPFRIDAVRLSGASSAYAPGLRAELSEAARDMTTLHVREGELREIARRYPAVVSLEADADLPRRLTIRVVERPPVGVARGTRGRRVPVAADGTLLHGHPLDRSLPRLPGRAPKGRRAGMSATVAGARIAAAAPRPLAAWLEQVRRSRVGWVVELKEGPELRLGTARDLARKWAAAAAVLSARSARGARYVDVRLPDRPAAGSFSSAPARAAEERDDATADAGQQAETNPQPGVYGSRQP